MLKFYTIYYTTYHNGTKITTKSAETLCDESQVNEWCKTFTWGNLTDLYYEIGGLACGFNIWDFKRGRIVSFYDGGLFGDKADVKEWKHKDLNIEVKCEWHEWNPSIAKILEWHDGEKLSNILTKEICGLGLTKPLPCDII